MTPEEQRAYDLAAEATVALGMPYIPFVAPLTALDPSGRALPFLERGASELGSDAYNIAGKMVANSLTVGGAAIGGGLGGFSKGLGGGLADNLGSDPIPTSIGLAAALVAGVVAVGGLVWLVTPRVQTFRYRGTYSI